MIRLIYLLKSNANLLMVLFALRENISQTLIEWYDCFRPRFESNAILKIGIARMRGVLAILFNQKLSYIVVLSKSKPNQTLTELNRVSSPWSNTISRFQCNNIISIVDSLHSIVLPHTHTHTTFFIETVDTYALQLNFLESNFYDVFANNGLMENQNHAHTRTHHTPTLNMKHNNCHTAKKNRYKVQTLGKYSKNAHTHTPIHSHTQTKNIGSTQNWNEWALKRIILSKHAISNNSNMFLRHAFIPLLCSTHTDRRFSFNAHVKTHCFSKQPKDTAKVSSMRLFLGVAGLRW